jgi:WD40 repeat protein/serine/threonine protein kinase
MIDPSHSQFLDDPDFQSLLVKCLESLQRGENLDVDALAREFPKYASELAQFLDDGEKLKKITSGFSELEASPTHFNNDKSTTRVNSESGDFSVGDTLRYIGDYEILEGIARGGMGVVFKARQKNLKRVVALKMILAGRVANHEEVERFRREAHAAGRLKHPNIVPVHEIGEHEGRHYLTMDFIEGVSLADKIREEILTPRVAAELVCKVAEAIEYAHEQGVVHRDLKPANILIDNQGQPHITDFGLVKLLESIDEESRAELTASGDIIGTPSYMSPEQAAGHHHLIGPVSDIYSLGAILYSTLTGRAPFVAETSLDTLLQVMNKEPVSPKVLNPLVPMDLETICLKCLAKENYRRYGTAQLLADDLNRFLEGRPVLARPVGRISKSLRWCRRNKAITFLLSMMIAILITGTAISTWLAMAERSQRIIADDNKIIAERNAILARESEKRAQANAERATRIAEKELFQRNIAEQRELSSRRNLYLAHMTLAQRGWERNDLKDVTGFLKGQIPKPDQQDVRTIGWKYLWEHSNRSLHTLDGNSGTVWSIDISPDSNTIATGHDTGIVKIWNLKNAELLYEIKEHSKGVSSVVFSDDGSMLASGSDDQQIVIWDLVNSRLLKKFNARSGNVRSISFSHDGSMIATGGSNTSVKLWDLDKGIIADLSGHFEELNSVCFSPDDNYIASASDDKTVKIWDVSTQSLYSTLKGHTDHVTDLEYSPDGKVLMSGSKDFSVILWEVANSTRLRSINTESRVWSVRFINKGSHLITGGRDNSLKIWNSDTGKNVSTLKGHTRDVQSVAISNDGEYIVSGSRDQTIKIWNLKSSFDKWVIHDGPNGIWSIAFSPDGKILASGSVGHQIKLWNSDTQEQIATLQGHYSTVHSLVFSPNGKFLASGSWDKTIRIWNMENHRTLHVLEGHAVGVKDIDITQDGKYLASCSGDQTARIWNFHTGKELFKLEGHKAQVERLTFSPDGSTLATTSRDQTVRIWNVATGQLIKEFDQLDSVVWGIDYSPDGQTLATVDIEGKLLLWNPKTGNILATFRGHKSKTNVVKFSPDGKLLASTGNDRSVRLWDVKTGIEHATLWGHTDSIRELEFSPDGKTLLTAGDDSSIRFWKVWP